jgi:predicted TIM-barrel fold metal-dependent hydrolase
VHLIEYIAGYGANGELRAIGDGKGRWATGEVVKVIPKQLGQYGVSYDRLIEFMDENFIEKAVILQSNFYGFQNEYIYEAIKKYPDRFTGAAFFNPFCKNADKISQRLIHELGFKILKFELSTTSGFMSYQPSFDLMGDTMQAVYKFAAHNNIIVVFDIGRFGTDSYQVDAVRKCAEKYSSIQFVVCHLLLPGKNCEEILKRNLNKLNLPNICFDIATLPLSIQTDCLTKEVKSEGYPFPTAIEYLQIAKNILGSKKLMWGSDLPATICINTYGEILTYIEGANIFNTQEINDIFYNNANRVYF